MRGMVLFEVEIGAAHSSTEGVSFTRHVLIKEIKLFYGKKKNSFSENLAVSLIKRETFEPSVLN